MTITKIAFVGHPTRDMEASRAFYELLGLDLTMEHDGWCEFDTPDGKSIALDTYTPEAAPDAGTYLALETDDIDAEVARLEAAGTPIVKPVWDNRWPTGELICRMAIVTDPGGNAIMLHQIADARKHK